MASLWAQEGQPLSAEIALGWISELFHSFEISRGVSWLGPLLALAGSQGLPARQGLNSEPVRTDMWGHGSLACSLLAVMSPPLLRVVSLCLFVESFTPVFILWQYFTPHLSSPFLSSPFLPLPTLTFLATE